VLIAPALAAAMLTGCGSSRPPVRGAALFRADCSSCHTLAGHTDARHQGGDLLHLDVGGAALRQFTAEMPTPRRLSAVQVRTIDAYLLRVSRAARAR
jgi:mono/diheme cytochrome c family protein